jgi:hypothetical protein
VVNLQKKQKLEVHPSNILSKFSSICFSDVKEKDCDDQISMLTLQIIFFVVV